MRALLTFIFCGLFFYSFSQDGFDVIRKAELKFEKGNFEKSLTLLDKAEAMDYGFCGNAWIDADRSINQLRARIYLQQGQYELSRNYLDSIYWGFYGDGNDSLRVLTYQMEIGADSLSGMIDESILSAVFQCDSNECFVSIPLVNNKDTMKLSAGKQSFVFRRQSLDINAWREEFMSSSIYRQIKQGG